MDFVLDEAAGELVGELRRMEGDGPGSRGTLSGNHETICEADRHFMTVCEGGNWY